MKLNEISKEELELMGYDDIALFVLQENGQKMKLRDIFEKVCSVLELPSDTVDNQLMDFFEQLSINKKFTMLDNGYWDLQTRHNFDLVVDEDEEVMEEEKDIIEDDIEDEEDIFYDKGEETDDVEEDDLADLVVVDDIEEDNL